MKTISDELKNYLAKESTSLAKCYEIETKNGDVTRFTNLDKDIEIDGLVYYAAQSIDEDASQITSNVEYDNVTIEGIISSHNISENDLLNGKYDNAKISVFLVNYENVELGKLYVFNGFIDSIECVDGKFTASLKSLSSKLDVNIVKLYSPVCRCGFCDGKCGLNASNYTFSGEITYVENRQKFRTNSSEITEKESGYFNYGLLTFTGGGNLGESFEIKYITDGSINLFRNVTHELSLGDTFQIIAGCDKEFDTCVSKFSNAINFRGEPHVPGTEFILSN